MGITYASFFVAMDGRSTSFFGNIIPLMNIVLPMNLIIVLLGSLCASSVKVNIDDFVRGKYDFDFIVKRYEDIKIAALSCQSAGFPYTDPDVKEDLLDRMISLGGFVSKVRVLACNVGRPDMTYTELILKGDVDMEELVMSYKLMVRIKKDELVALNKLISPAKEEYLKRSIEGFTQNIDYLVKIKKMKRERNSKMAIFGIILTSVILLMTVALFVYFKRKTRSAVTYVYY
jgi:hypothetical protein